MSPLIDVHCCLYVYDRFDVTELLSPSVLHFTYRAIVVEDGDAVALGKTETPVLTCLNFSTNYYSFHTFCC